MLAVSTAGTAFAPRATPNLLIAGDSWGTDIAGGGFFDSVLKKHSCDFKSTNIAIGGTTTGSWDSGRDLEKLKTNAKDHDYVWITLGGNDARCRRARPRVRRRPSAATSWWPRRRRTWA